MPHDARTAQQQCRLLSLPPELRNRIYELVLEGPTGIRIPFDQRNSLPPLLAARRQIRSEANSFYFGDKVFSIPDSLCIPWLEHLTPESQANVRIISNCTSRKGRCHICDVILAGVREGKLHCGRLILCDARNRDKVVV